MSDMTQSEYLTQQRRERERRRRYEQRRRAHIRKQILVFGGGGLLLILLLVLLLRGCSRKPREVSRITSTANMKVLPEIYWDPDDQPELSEDGNEQPVITLAAVGDIMCYDEQINDAQTGGGYDFSPALAEVADFLSSTNLAVGNLETTFADDNPYAGKPNFNAPPELAGALAEAGFDILSTANTYSIQYGINGLNSTLSHIQQAGMEPVGTYHSQNERDTNGSAVIREVGGVKIAFLAYTKGVNNMFLPDGYNYSVNLLYEDYYYAYTGFRKREILSDIDAVKAAGADVIVCMLHWGSEYETKVSESQQTIADTLIAAGVDIILGSHSHVLGEVELREVSTTDGESRTGLVAWSLGNFLSNMSREGTMESIVLRVGLQMDDEGKLKLSAVDYLPICTSYDTDNTHYRVTNVAAQIDRYLSVAEGAVDAETYSELTAVSKRIQDRVGSLAKPVEVTNSTASDPAALINESKATD